MSRITMRLSATVVGALAVPAAFAGHGWQSVDGEIGYFEHPAQAQKTLTREEMLAKEAAQDRQMAGKGYRWNPVFGVYEFSGPGSPPESSTFTREQVLAREEAQDREMRAKGMRWNPIFGVYERASAP